MDEVTVGVGDQGWWTDERIAHLRERWGKADLRVIADELGTTRGAIAGKAMRLGLSRLPRGSGSGSRPVRSRSREAYNAYQREYQREYRRRRRQEMKESGAADRGRAEKKSVPDFKRIKPGRLCFLMGLRAR